MAQDTYIVEASRVLPPVKDRRALVRFCSAGRQQSPPGLPDGRRVAIDRVDENRSLDREEQAVGVARIYHMTLDGGIWKLWRQAPLLAASRRPDLRRRREQGHWGAGRLSGRADVETRLQPDLHQQARPPDHRAPPRRKTRLPTRALALLPPSTAGPRRAASAERPAPGRLPGYHAVPFPRQVRSSPCQAGPRAESDRRGQGLIEHAAVVLLAS